MRQMANGTSASGTCGFEPFVHDLQIVAHRLAARTKKSAPVGHRVDHGTICGRNCANSGHYKQTMRLC
jgi:hypothetical protein